MEQEHNPGTWSLDPLFAGFSDEAFTRDYESLQQMLPELKKLVQAPARDAAADVRKIVDAMEAYHLVAERLSTYTYLRVQQNTADGEAVTWSGRVDSLMASAAGTLSDLRKKMAELMQDNAVWDADEKLADYWFYLQNVLKEQKHMLPDQEEDLVAKMNLTGARAWSRLFDSLTSTVRAHCDGKTYNLSEIRNMAYSEDAEVRKKAYEAELACYADIELPASYALCSIKKQANMLAERRGYASVLDMNLSKTNMKPESLQALLSAIEGYLPIFWRYLKAKAKLLGHEGALPWYDLFAPVGRMDASFGLEEAEAYLKKTYAGFSDAMVDMITKAFRNNWIDFYPCNGKVGGAFCSSVPWLRESRILTNFSGTFDAVVTLAHELGHGYHGLQIYDNLPLNQNYNMQLAETASTFNEIFLLDKAVAEAKTPEEELFLLESLLMGNTQVILDIYSRFTFEKEVVERCRQEDLCPEQLKQIMYAAQRCAYGEGLDKNFQHPYMWCCKIHYYIDTEDFYNFPYAFGALFSMGLYGLYKQNGAAFVAQYHKLLRNTTVMETEDVAASVGIDITTPAFWSRSLDVLADYVQQYERLAEELVPTV